MRMTWPLACILVATLLGQLCAGQRALLNAACQSGSGKCTWRWQCDGTRVSDQCLGGPLVTCCVKPDIEYIGQPCDNDQGTCQLSSGCQGVEVPGACPGSSAISCCVPAGAGEYAALGDSYASGVGAKSDSWIASSGSCYRSTDSWAYSVRTYIARQAGQPVPLRFKACAGAVVADVRNNQLSALSTATRWVTLSVGGNDLEFGKTIQECVLLRQGSDTPDFDCTDEVTARQALLPDLKKSLVAIYTEVKQRAPNAQILVTGYPYLASKPYGDVLGFAGLLTQSEVDALEEGVDKADATIQEACVEAGVTFVDTRQEFIGKSCGGDPQWINCLVYNPVLGRDSGAAVVRSFHPNAAGNAAYARVVSPRINAGV